MFFFFDPWIAIFFLAVLVYFRASAGDPKHNLPDKMVIFGLLGNMLLHITNITYP